MNFRSEEALCQTKRYLPVPKKFFFQLVKLNCFNIVSWAVNEAHQFQ